MLCHVSVLMRTKHAQMSDSILCVIVVALPRRGKRQVQVHTPPPSFSSSSFYGVTPSLSSSMTNNHLPPALSHPSSPLSPLSSLGVLVPGTSHLLALMHRAVVYTGTGTAYSPHSSPFANGLFPGKKSLSPEKKAFTRKP